MNKDNETDSNKETAKPKGIMSKLRSIFDFIKQAYIVAKQTFAFINKIGDIIGTVRKIIMGLNRTLVIVTLFIFVSTAGFQGYEEYKRIRRLIEKVEGYIDEYKAKADQIERDIENLRDDFRKFEIEFKGKARAAKQKLEDDIDATKQELKDKADATKQELKAKEQELKDKADATKQELKDKEQELQDKERELSDKLQKNKDKLEEDKKKLKKLLDR